jgi:hypothetical protein
MVHMRHGLKYVVSLTVGLCLTGGFGQCASRGEDLHDAWEMALRNDALLQAESLRTESRRNFYTAIYDAVLAEYQLKRAMGVL